MILIPEIETVLILVPRTGSGSLRRAVAAAYPRSILIYRHMEADGVPAGYDRWRKIGVVRDPVDRLWSLFKFLRKFGGNHDPEYIASMRRSVSGIPFDTWVRTNQTVFTSPYDSAGLGRYFPEFTVRHPLPENRKSQYVYLRPDLGTLIYRYDRVATLAADLSLASLPNHNATDSSPAPSISPETREYVERMFAWDLRRTRVHIRLEKGDGGVRDGWNRTTSGAIGQP